MKISGSKKYLPFIVLCIFALCFIYTLTAPISDPDLFWHLANAKWIIENRMLPDHDPFTFTTQTYAYSSYQRTFFILTSYWLAQLFIYFFYFAGGYWGILILRILIFSGCIGMLFKWLREKGYSLSETLFFLVPAAWALSAFVGERPNQLTYLFSIISLYYIYAVRDRNSKGWLLIPIMILWANSHGGFILGMIIIAMFTAFETLDFILQRRQGKTNAGYQKALLIYGMSFLACGINPSGFRVFPVLMEMTSDYATQVAENISPFTLFSTSGNHVPLLIAVTGSVVLLAGLILGARKRAGDILLSGGLFLFLIFFAFKSVRYVPFLVLLPVPAVATYLKPYLDRLRPLFKHVLVSLLLILFIAYLPPLESTVLKAPLVNLLYPENLVNFMKKNNIRDKMFNIYDIGGYLLWRLYPDTKVFIDGRGVVQKVFFAYLAVSQGSKMDTYGLPEWKSVLYSYNIKNIILTPLRTSGTMYDLVDRLYEDPEWRLVYIDGSSGAMLFRNDMLLPELPKILSYANILTHALKYRAQRPENPNIYITLAKVQLILGRKSEAIKALEEAIKQNPDFRLRLPGKALEYVTNNRIWW